MKIKMKGFTEDDDNLRPANGECMGGSDGLRGLKTRQAKGRKVRTDTVPSLWHLLPRLLAGRHTPHRACLGKVGGEVR